MAGEVHGCWPAPRWSVPTCSRTLRLHPLHATLAHARTQAKKVATVRLFDGADGRAWGASVSSAGLQVLCVSQFTLHATTRKPKPSYSRAMPADAARVLFEAFVAEMRRELRDDGRVSTGAFREMMAVSLVNDGPVTILLDSWNKDGTCFGAPEGVCGEEGEEDGESPAAAAAVGGATAAVGSSASAAGEAGAAAAPATASGSP